MIYVTHDQVEAMTLADKIVVLRAGVIEQVGTPLQLYDDPDNLFVAGFIGSPKMNFMKARACRGEAGRPSIELLEFGNVRVPMKLKGEAPKDGKPLTLGMRPEHFEQGG